MEIRNGFSLRTAIRFGWHVAALGCLSLSAHAQSDFAQKIWWKSDHNALSAEVNRVLGISSPTLPATGTPNVNGARFSNTAGTWPVATSKTGLPLSGKSVPIDVVARVKPASAAAALGRFAAKASPLGYALGVGVGLYDLAKELGYDVTTSGGQTVTQKLGLATDLWGVATNTQGAQIQIRASSAGDACTKNGHLWTPNPYQPGQMMCQITSQYVYTPYKVANTSQPGQLEPSSLAALENAIASQSGWPTTSAVSRAIADAIKNGEVIEYDPAQVTGPASKPGGSTTTQNPDGTTTTTNTTHNYTYNGPKVTVTTTTTTTTVNPSTGETTTSTTTDTTPVPDTPPEEEKSQCELTPNALGCAELDQPTEEIPRDTETITFQEENVFGSGSCPANLTTSIATLGQSVTVWDWSRTCQLALPLRALVLGLASFAALLIVMPGGSKT